ncbi:MAG: DegT/DnrJ/EryC1/StrS family aminotransferase [Magnetococcales bacterium]|nr:DegT/DnrJ/EryC1/StrS family aminotransferase [Magnetococcales bacterium]
MRFIDLQAQYHAYRNAIDSAIQTVVESALFINGPQVAQLETELARFVGVQHAVGFSSGTDSLQAILMAWGIAPGDEVITTPFTFIATAEVISLLGARPVFVDVDPHTLNLDPTQLEAAITPRSRVIMPVSLYGHCADFDAINAIADHHGLLCLEDGCQSFGARYRGRRSCGLSHAAATSFFPAKPLGCFGDGGMAFTNDGTLAERLRVIREHGQIARYQHAMLGFNGRLDTIQAAVLLAKLPHFEAEIAARQRVADYYRSRLAGRVQLPVVSPDNLSVYAQFTIRTPAREAVQHHLTAVGIPTAIHYPAPLHRQPVFAALGYPETAFPVANQAAQEVLSLPMHPFLSTDEQDQVMDALLHVLP